MVDYKLIFYTSVPCFLFALIYILFGYTDLFECLAYAAILLIISVLVSFFSGRNK